MGPWYEIYKNLHVAPWWLTMKVHYEPSYRHHHPHLMVHHVESSWCLMISHDELVHHDVPSICASRQSTKSNSRPIHNEIQWDSMVGDRRQRKEGGPVRKFRTTGPWKQKMIDGPGRNKYSSCARRSSWHARGVMDLLGKCGDCIMQHRGHNWRQVDQKILWPVWEGIGSHQVHPLYPASRERNETLPYIYIYIYTHVSNILETYVYT